MSNIDTVKEQLSNLISSGEFNNKSSEELSDILYNLSLALATNNKSLKNCIGIRILSLDNYNKYITNGTADGSISKNDINVWHFQNKKFNTHDRVTNDKSLGYEQAPIYIYMENSSDNSFKKSCVYHYNGYYSVELWHTRRDCTGPFTYYQNREYNKTDSLIGEGFHETSDFGKAVFINFSFRPCFVIIDNNKSANLFS